MEFNNFHFSNTEWLWGIGIIPLVCLAYVFFYRRATNGQRLENFIDPHLIPHLLKNSKFAQISLWKSMLLGSTLWMLLMAAMAGPRWDFTEIKNYRSDRVLLVLLDLSKSMDAPDINPSRLIRARQEIEDIINLGGDIRMGLVAFALDAHIVSPITSNVDNIRRLLPALSTDLIFVQGTRLTPALKTAEQMLASEISQNKNILIITDGGFQDQEAINIVEHLASQGVVVHSLGTATENGIKFTDEKGVPLKRAGKDLVSVLEREKLKLLSQSGNGQYFDTDYSDTNTKAILEQVNNRYNLQQDGDNVQGNRKWTERFYIFLIPFMLIVLPWFRKGFYFPVILVILLSSAAEAANLSISDRLFLSKEQQAAKAMEEIEDYDTAVNLFDDPYKKGIAYYKSGNYADAENCFRQNQRPEVRLNALYNLGSTLAKQNKFEEAVEVYKQILQEEATHEKTLHNMKIVKMLIVAVVEKKKDDQEEKKKKKNNDDNLPEGGGGGGGGDDNDEDDGGDKDEGNKKDKGNNKDNKPKDRDDKKDQSEDKNDADRNKGNDNKENKKNDGGNNSKSEGGEGQIDAEQWLDQIPNASSNFLKNQLYIESQKQSDRGTQEWDPW